MTGVGKKKRGIRQAKDFKAEEVAPKIVPVGPVYVEGNLHFSAYDLLRHELAQAKLLNALQAVGLKQREATAARAEFEERMRVFSADLLALQGVARQQEAALRALQAELSADYGLDVSKVTYDDQSGRIYPLGEPVPE